MALILRGHLQMVLILKESSSKDSDTESSSNGTDTERVILKRYMLYLY